MRLNGYFICISLVLLTSSCSSLKEPSGTTKLDAKNTSAYIPNLIRPDGSSYGTIFNDPTKRMAITTIIKNPDSSYTTKYLAEEQPDAGVTFVRSLTAKLEGDLKEPEITAMANLTTSLSTTLDRLTDKSRSLNYLRTALYRLNEASYNDFIDSSQTKELFNAILTSAKEIELKELENLPSTGTKTSVATSATVPVAPTNSPKKEIKKED